MEKDKENNNSLSKVDTEDFTDITKSSAETMRRISNIIKAILKLYTRLLAILFIVGLAFLSYSILTNYFNLSQSYSNLLVIVSKPVGLWTTIVIIFSIGIFLSLFKLKQQFWYGIFETAFGLATCYFTIKNIGTTMEVLSVIIAMGSTIYLMVRGISNVLEGIKKGYWCKTEIFEINSSSKYLTSKLKDRKLLVDILYQILKFITKFT